jgi:ABC-type phosphate/phosphonate transport system substrate-binding protein
MSHGGESSPPDRAASWIAALPMYDLPELRRATDAFWRRVATGLRRLGLAGVPDKLTRPLDPNDAWLSPTLLFGQTCSWPLVSRLGRRVTVLGLPCYMTPWATPGRYRSLFVSRRADGPASLDGARGRRFAFNEDDSLSGLVAPLAEVARRFGAGPYFDSSLRTGGHRDSLKAVRASHADLAAIDCVTWELLRRLAPGELDGLEVIDTTASFPALPYIAVHSLPGDTVENLRVVLAETAGRPSEATRSLLLEGVSPADEADFEAVRAAGRAAASVGGFRVSGKPPQPS